MDCHSRIPRRPLRPATDSLARQFLGLDLVIETILGFDPNVRSSRGFSAVVGAFVLTIAVAEGFQNLADRDVSIWPVVGPLVAYGAAVALWGVFEYLVSPMTVLLDLLPVAYAIFMSVLGQPFAESITV